MPWRNGSGPYGTGPVGWQRGSCQTGQRHWPVWRGFRTQQSPTEERDYLREQEAQLEEALKWVRDRQQTLS